MRPPNWLKRLAVPLADKVVYASSAYVSLRSSVNELTNELMEFKAAPDNPLDARLVDFVRLIQPVMSEELRMLRVGGPNDGGYVMVDDFEVAGAISIGIGSDVSWDQDIARRGIAVAMFDPTIRSLPKSVPNGHFHRLGIGDGLRDDRYVTLESLVAKAGFADSGDLLLKMDVEGAEWGALAAVPEAHLQRFRQIVVEFHHLDRLRDAGDGEFVIEQVRKLRHGHLPVHIHANNYDNVTRFGRTWFPNAIEVTYVRRDCVAAPQPATTISTPWDAPCDPRVAEISLEAVTRVPPESR
jgi:hypothetical protein